MAKRKRSDKQKARATAWGWCSKYVRLRDAIEYHGTMDYAFCVTCGTLKPIGKTDAAHFISREHESIMFDERNIHASCAVCNRFKQGRWPEYFEFMEDHYGLETIRHLMRQRKIQTKLTVEQYRNIAKYYRVKFKDLKESFNGN